MNTAMKQSIKIEDNSSDVQYKLMTEMLIADSFTIGGQTFDIDPLKERAVYYVPVRIEQNIANLISGAPFAEEQYFRAVATSKQDAIDKITKRFSHLPQTGRSMSILSTDRIFKKEI